MSTSSGAAAPVFSYAQAAKGLTPATSTQSTSRNESPAASEKGTKDRVLTELTNGPVSTVKSQKPRSEVDDKQSADSVVLKSSSNSEDLTSLKSSAKESADKESPAQAHVQSTNHADKPSTVDASNVTPTQDSSKDELEAHLPNGQASNSEETPDLTSLEKTIQTTVEKKSKDSEDDWEKVSVPSVSAEKEFKAAPIPTVNIWQQRMKDLEQQRTTTVPNATSQPQKAKSGNEEPKRKSTSRETGSSEREPKSVDSTKSTTRKDKDAPSTRNSRPGSQQGEKADANGPPPVDDAHFWPTPESSTVEDRRKSTSYEKTDKPEAKLGSQKSHGKWVHVPFVPTAKFETQLPTSVSRRGGRGGARGRDSGGRGAHSGVSGEKQEVVSMGPPPVPKQSGEQDRGRRSEGQRGARGASVPSSTTRPTSGEDATSGFRKGSGTYTKDQSPMDNFITVSTPTQHTSEETPRTDHSSRSSSRHTGNVGGRGVDGEGAVPQNQMAAGFSQVPEQAARYPYSFDRFKSASAGSSRGNGEFGRDRGSGRNRDWSRDKPDSAREKVESWRDREPSGDQTTRRESRPERGRGGYRGRGNHTYSQTFGSSHAYTAPLPQNGFEPPSRSNSHTESRSRQSSQPFQPTQAASTPRTTNARSQSIPVGMMYPGYYNGVPAMPQGLPSLHTDVQMYGYPSPMQMQPGIMSAMPYNDPLNSYALLSMVMTQIEYYFSIDNLCKDLFLRKNMDSQGYVLLSVISNFKRIKTLTEDNMSMDNLRYVCQQVKSVEFLPGTDGDDRLRRRDNWRDFVLPMEERFESARNDGPLASAEPYNHVAHQEPHHPLDQGLGFGHLRSPSLTNGTFHPSSPLTYLPGAPMENHVTSPSFGRAFEDVPSDGVGRPIMPSYPQVPPASMRSPPRPGAAPSNPLVNGHHRQISRADIEENIFPDDQIPNIHIRMRPSGLAEAVESENLPSIARVASNENESSAEDKEDSNANKDLGHARLPSLRGGAGSPQQLEQFSNMSFGFSHVIPTGDDSSIVYFTKDGFETQLPPPQAGQYDQTYLSLHDVAFQQRLLGVDGALEPVYSFWSDFLVDKFNMGMYEEFKATAINDLQEGSGSGMAHLVRYYGKLLTGPIPISERLAADMVQLSREEKPDARPVFQAMRTALRNGATHMKTIKRLRDALTAEEREELDKSG